MAVVLIASLYFAFSSNQEPSQSAIGIAKTATANGSGASQTTKQADDSVPLTQRNDSMPTAKFQNTPIRSLYAELASTNDYAASLARLQAMPDDPNAQYLTTLVVSACGSVLPEYVETFKRDSLKRIGTQALSKEFAERRTRLIDREAAKCAKVSKSSLNTIAEKRFDTITKAARLGDPYAKAELVNLGIDIPIEFRKQLLAELPAMAATGDPFILNRVAEFFVRFKDRDFNFDLPNGSVTGQEINLAFQLLACQRGENCGPDARQLEVACVRLGRCGSSSLLDYFQTYELTPARANSLNELEQLLAVGIATGSWPPGLWPKT